jgi:hypothetical protein
MQPIEKAALSTNECKRPIRKMIEIDCATWLSERDFRLIHDVRDDPRFDLHFNDLDLRTAYSNADRKS